MKYWLNLVALWAISFYANGYNGQTTITKQSQEEHGVQFGVAFQEINGGLLQVTATAPRKVETLPLIGIAVIQADRNNKTSLRVPVSVAKWKLSPGPGGDKGFQILLPGDVEPKVAFSVSQEKLPETMLEIRYGGFDSGWTYLVDLSSYRLDSASLPDLEENTPKPAPPGTVIKDQSSAPSGMSPQVPVNSQATLIESVGGGFEDDTWAYPAGLLPIEFPGLTNLGGPLDKGLSPKGAWRKPVVMKDETSGVVLHVNCYRRRDKASPSDEKTAGSPLLPIKEPDYAYQGFEFHDLPCAVAAAENRQVIAFRRDDVLYKIEAIGGSAGARNKLAAATAEAIWKSQP